MGVCTVRAERSVYTLRPFNNQQATVRTGWLVPPDFDEPLPESVLDGFEA